MSYSRTYKLTGVVLITIMVLASSLFLIQSVKDGDFFWHLKTGEWILQNGSLPSEDFFAHTSPKTYTKWQHFVLTSYWLSQVIYSLFHLAGGMNGIILFRFFIASMFIYVLLKRNQGDMIVYIALVMIFMVNLLSFFPLERPHVFSFLFFAILL